MSEREQYDQLIAQSDSEYQLAGVAMREGNYNQYRYHTDRSWAFVNEAEPIRQRLSPTERAEIKNKAFKAMATAFVRGLGRVQ